MNNYYHVIPQCPECGSPLEGPGSIIRNCGKYHICTGDGTECHIFGQALPWRIRLNDIEASYIEWIAGNKPERILVVTWPFRNPEIFATVLGYEYLIKNSENVMIVVPDGDTVSGTSILAKQIPDLIYVQDDAPSNSPVNGTDKIDVFPKVRSYAYTIRELSVHGRIHAGNRNGFIRRIRERYGEYYTGRVIIQAHGKPSMSRFGKIKLYNREDFKSFYEHSETMISDRARDNLIFHEYVNPDRLISNIERYQPRLVIILNIINPFINDVDFPRLKQNLDGRTVLIVGDFNRDEINGAIKNTGVECIATLKSFEFIARIDDKTNLPDITLPRTPHVEIVKYNRNPHIKLSDKCLQKRLDSLLKIARITLTHLNSISTNPDDKGLDDIINDAFNAKNGDYGVLCGSIPDRDANPWADEVAEYVHKNNMDSPDNCIVIFKNSAIPDALARHGLKNIKTASLYRLSRSRFRNVIMTFIPKSFNPELVQAERIIVFSDPDYQDYINDFFKYRRYLDYTNYFIFNDKNMPDMVSDIMDGIGKSGISGIDYEYIPVLSDPHNYGDEYDSSGQSSRYTIKRGERMLALYDSTGNLLVLPTGMDIYVIKSDNLVELNTDDRNIINDIMGSFIPLDRSGFYASVKARLTYFLIENGAGIRVNGMEFSEAYKISRIWLDSLSELSECTPDLAKSISSLGITASNAYYISTWWRITETYKYVYMYRIERPKNLADMIRIFEFIHQMDGNKDFTDAMAIKCYGACVGIQAIRNRLLHGRYPNLSERLRTMISSLGKSGKSFQVSRACFQIADTDINAMVVYGNDHGGA